MLVLEHSGGERMGLQAYLTRTVCRTLPLPFGTRKSQFKVTLKPHHCLISHSDFLKERLFGLSNPQGNHGESIKEAHFHLDNTPTVRARL